MWKKSLVRGVSSYCISVSILLAVSAILALGGKPTVCVPSFIDRVGGNLAASLLQPLIVGLIGAAFGAGSVLFEIERWSLLMQGLTHLGVTAAVYVLVHLICFAPFTPPIVVSLAAGALASYSITWGAQYFVWRAKVRRLNAQIHQKYERNDP